MPDDTFLQKFHNLASVDDEVRCRAAQGIVRALQSGKMGEEELPYTVRRLVRGVQSSRQFCRQGFALALAELLHVMPNQLSTVLQLLEKSAELQSGLRANEQKDRLLARTFVYGAIIQAGCLGSLKGDDIIAKLGRGLWQLYSARSYLNAVSMCLLKEACAELCAAGRHSSVAEVVSHWTLDEKLDDTGHGFELLDAHTLSLVLSLRIAYEESDKKPTSWPSCVRKDLVKNNVAVVARNVGQVLASCPMTDVVPQVLEDFCRWWLRPSKGRDAITLQEEIWPALEEGLFPVNQTAPSTAQAFRGIAELGRCIGRLGGPEASQLLVGLFKLVKVWDQLFWCVASRHSPAHQAASFAHAILVELVGGVKPAESQSKKANKKRKRSEATNCLPKADPLSLDDDSRLLILSTLQEKQAFQRVPHNLKRQWQQALLSPLSPKGVRARCGAIISSLVQGSGPAMRVVAAQLEQLAVHGKVPDEAILAVVFQQFLASFILPPPGSSTVVFSLRAFKKDLALPEMLTELEDVSLPVQEIDEEERRMWRQKLWSTTAQLAKRTWPEAAEKLVSGEDFSTAEVFSGGEEGPGSLVRSSAYSGCLSDGSLMVFRLLQWWNYVVTKNPEKANSKKKKSNDALCKCAVEFQEADIEMRQRCLELCQSIMDVEEGGKSGMSARQKNAVCCLPLSLSLVMLDKDAPVNASTVLGELLSILEHLVTVVQGPKPKKKIAEALAAFAPVAAELYVGDSLAMIREACKLTWRELAFYVADETLTQLCSSVCGKAAGDEAEDEADDMEDEDEEDEEDEDPDGSRKAVFDKAIAAMKAKNEKEKAADEEDEEDVTTLDQSGVLSELLDGGASELMNSFATSRLDGTNDQSKKKKLTKRQQKLRLQQDDLIRRLREVDLVESFLLRCGAKRDASMAMVDELQMAMVELNHKVKMSKDDEAGGDADGKGVKGNTEKTGKKATKGDTTLRTLEESLSQRVHKMLSKLLRTSCKASSVQILAGRASVEDWDAKARALCERSLLPKFNASSSQVLEVTASYFYFLCAAHRAAVEIKDESEHTMGQGWTLAEELLTMLLKEWSGKKECDKWCQAALKAFVVRVPQLLLKLPWTTAIKGAKKAFAQRSQLGFLQTHVFRPLPPETTNKADVKTQMAFADSCAKVCAELLNSTVEEDGNATSAAQRQKLRKEVLQTLKSIYKLRQKSEGLPADVSSVMADAITSLRDSLPSQQRRGEVYNLTVHLLRLVRPQVQQPKRDRSTSRGRPKDREEAGDGEEVAEVPMKKRKGRSGSISRSPSLHPQSPASKPHPAPLKEKRRKAQKS